MNTPIYIRNEILFMRNYYKLTNYTQRTPQEKGQTFEVMISSDNYQQVEKNNLKEALKNATFEKHNITVEQFITFVDRGHIYTPIYNSDIITSKDRKNENFVGTNIVSIDVDKSDISTYEVQRALKKNSIEPTFIYNTLSHNKEKNGVICERYRLGYIFNKCLSQGEFYATSKVMVDKVKEVLGDKVEIDSCSISPNQLYFGGKKFSFQKGKKPWNGYMRGTKYNEYLNEYQANNHQKEEIKNTSQKEKNKVSNSLIKAFDFLGYSDFIKKYNKFYQYVYRCEGPNWIDAAYQYINKNTYFKLPYYFNRVQDGDKRRLKFFQMLALKRVIKPTITANEMFYNAVKDARFFDNEDGTFSTKYIVGECNRIMKWEIKDIEQTYKETISYLKTKQPKSGIITKWGVNVNSVKKEIKYKLIGDFYDKDLTIERNLEVLKSNGIEVSRSTLMKYRKDKEVVKVDHRYTINKEEILSLYDFSKSLRNNHKYMQEMGVKVSLGTLSKIITNLK